jgi:hypothetical protein
MVFKHHFRLLLTMKGRKKRIISIRKRQRKIKNPLPICPEDGKRKLLKIRTSAHIKFEKNNITKRNKKSEKTDQIKFRYLAKIAVKMTKKGRQASKKNQVLTFKTVSAK